MQICVKIQAYEFFPKETFTFWNPLSFGKDPPILAEGGSKDSKYSELAGTLCT